MCYLSLQKGETSPPNKEVKRNHEGDNERGCRFACVLVKYSEAVGRGKWREQKDVKTKRRSGKLHIWGFVWWETRPFKKTWKKLFPFPSSFLLIPTSEFMVNYFYKSLPSFRLHSNSVAKWLEDKVTSEFILIILLIFSPTSLKRWICSCKFSTSPGFKVTVHLIISLYWPSYSGDAWLKQ